MRTAEREHLHATSRATDLQFGLPLFEVPRAIVPPHEFAEIYFVVFAFVRKFELRVRIHQPPQTLATNQHTHAHTHT